MKKYLFITLFFAIGFFFIGEEANAQSVSGSLNNLGKSRTSSGSVVLSIPGGIHVNSFRPRSEYAIPTRVSVTGLNGIKAYGVTYPAGKLRKFAFSEEMISVYENRAYMGFKYTVPSGYSSNTVRVKVSITYQACTNEVCYPPKTKTFTISERVK